MDNKIKTYFFILLILAFSTFSFAQRQTGSVTGKIMDIDSEPLPGASVTLIGSAMMGALTYTTARSGEFRFPVVPPGRNYIITVEMPGFQSEKREGIIVHVGKTATIFIKLKQTTIEEEISVAAISPTIDFKSTKVNVNYSDDILENIPLRRDYYDVINLAPGIVSEEDPAARTFTSHGSTVRTNQVTLDGVILDDIARGINPTNIPFDMYEEIEIEVGAHPAEVGFTDGAFVNIVTKSGGNEFHGGVNISFFNDDMVRSLIPSSEAEAVGLNRPTGYKKFGELSLNIGGPILKDKFWFFLAGQYLQLAIEKETYPDGIFDLTHEEIMAFGKFTFSLHRNLKLVGLWNYGNIYEPFKVTLTTSFTPPFYREKASLPRIDRINHHSILGRVSWIMDQDTFFDFKISYFRFFEPEYFQPELDPNTPNIIEMTNMGWFGSPRYNAEVLKQRYLISGSGTYFNDNFLSGIHEIKAGIEYELSRMDWDRWKKNPYIYFHYNGQPWALMNFQPYWGLFYAWNSGEKSGDNVSKDRIRRFSVYVQDNFTIKNRLTLNLGLRYDVTHGDNLGGVFKLAGANDPVISMLAPDHFKETVLEGRNSVIVWKDLSPRLGLALDVFGDGKTALKASWSRYHEYLIVQYITAMNPLFSDVMESYWWDDNRDGIIDVNDRFLPYMIPPNPDTYVLEDRLDPNLKSPYMDEIVVGLEHEVIKDVSVGVSYIHRNKTRIVEDVEKLRGQTPDSGWWLPFTQTDPGWDGELGTEDDKPITVFGVKAGAPKNQLWFTNPIDAKRKYRAFEIVCNKRWSNRWQFMGSLTLSKFEGNIDAGFMDTWGFDDAFNDPNWMVNRYGRLYFDRPVSIKLMGSVLLPYDFMLSCYYVHMSGAAYPRTLRIQLPNEDKYEVPGSYVDVYGDPAGERRVRARNNFDLRIEKSIYLGKAILLGIYLDIFNLFGESWYDIDQDSGGIIYNDGTFETWPTYGQFYGANGLRTFKLSARFTF